jgi:hypothetical protein
MVASAESRRRIYLSHLGGSGGRRRSARQAAVRLRGRSEKLPAVGVFAYYESRVALADVGFADGLVEEP